MSKSHGGARSGAGRPRLPEHLKKKSEAVRLPLDIAQKAKSGYYERLEALIADWQQRATNAAPNSPQWKRLREFLTELSALDGKET